MKNASNRAASPAPMVGKLVLSSQSIEVKINPLNGALVSIKDVSRGIELIGEPALAENFRLLVPLTDWRGHYVYGKEQTLSECVSEDGQVELVWRSLRSARGVFPIEFRLRIRIEDSGVIFQTSLSNRSEFKIEEVLSPALGGLANPLEKDQWNLHHSQWNGLGREWSFYSQCQNVYLGPSMPTHTLDYPGTANMPWLDLYHTTKRQGVYFCQEDPAPRFGSWLFQLQPAANWGGSSWVWPDAGIERRPIGMTLAWTAFPHVLSGKDWCSAPFAIRFHDGIWYEAARLYRKWYDGHFVIDRSNSWLDREDAWQSTIISYPEDTIGFRFEDLPKLAKAALSAGIRVLQIDGWDQGGIDRDYPHYVPDLRLGTATELREAISCCQSLGVRILLFSNLTVVNIETEWYGRELHRYTVRDSRGHEADAIGWEYNTISGLVGNSKPRMRFCNPAHAEFGRIMQDVFRDIIDLGADGTQVDKVGGGVALSGRPDGHPKLGHLPVDESSTAPVIEAFARHRNMTDQRRTDYGIAAETHWDRLFPYVEASYSRHWYEDAPQTTAVAFPELRQTCCVTGSSDFALVANCLRLGHIINIEAECLHGSIDDVPLMREFVSKALALRRQLGDFLWMSRLVDPHAHVEVTGDSRVKYCLHESRVYPGVYSLVLNHFSTLPLSVDLKWLDRSKTETKLYTINNPSGRILPTGEVLVPPGDCVVLVSHKSEEK